VLVLRSVFEWWCFSACRRTTLHSARGHERGQMRERKRHGPTPRGLPAAAGRWGACSAAAALSGGGSEGLQTSIGRRHETSWYHWAQAMCMHETCVSCFSPNVRNTNVRASRQRGLLGATVGPWHIGRECAHLLISTKPRTWHAVAASHRAIVKSSAAALLSKNAVALEG